jgi:hypothetical protein
MHVSLDQLFTNHEIKNTLENAFEIPSLVSFSMTNKKNKERACLLILRELNTLISYCENQYDKNLTPSLAKRIYDIWLQNKKLIDTSITSDLSFPLIHVRPIFDLLKTYFHVVPVDDQADILKLPIPCFLTEMTSQDLVDEDTWRFCGHYIRRIESIVVELKKLGLFQPGNYDNSSFNVFSTKQQTVAAFFLDCYKASTNNLCMVRYYSDGRALLNNYILVRYDFKKNLKWVNLENITKCFFTVPSTLTPLSDLKKQCYTNLRNHILKQSNFYPLVSRDLTLNLGRHKWIFRLSTNDKDSYGNLKIVLSSKTAENRVYHSRLDIEKMHNIDEFNQKVSNKLAEIARKSIMDANLLSSFKT